MIMETHSNLQTRTSGGEAFFQKILSHPLGEASLAGYLHQMELTGARWILELPIESWTKKIHHHAKEEMKHSEIMHAEATGLRNRLEASQAQGMNEAGDAIFEATQKYMDAIFKGCLKTIVQFPSIKGDQKRLANYYLLSLLLERRMMKTYPHVVQLASTRHFIDAAKKIISDERDHLKEIIAGVEEVVLPHGVDLDRVYAFEEVAYLEFQASYLGAL